jgi:hypothetical protein
MTKKVNSLKAATDKRAAFFILGNRVTVLVHINFFVRQRVPYFLIY